MKRALLISLSVAVSFRELAAAAEPKRIAEGWDYTQTMRKIAAKFTGKEGVVIHVGDSITHANPYCQWARYGKGKAGIPPLKDLVKKYNPRMVVLMLGTNDAS